MPIHLDTVFADIAKTTRNSTAQLDGLGSTGYSFVTPTQPLVRKLIRPAANNAFGVDQNHQLDNSLFDTSFDGQTPSYVFAGYSKYNIYEFSNNVLLHATPDTVVAKSNGAGGITEAALSSLNANDDMYFHRYLFSTPLTIDTVENRMWYIFGWCNAGGDAWFDYSSGFMFIAVPGSNVSLAISELTSYITGGARSLNQSTDGRRIFVYNSEVFPEFSKRFPKGAFPTDDLRSGSFSDFACYMAGAWDAVGTYVSTADQECISLNSNHLDWLKNLKYKLLEFGIYVTITGAAKTNDWPDGQYTWTLKTAPGYMQQVLDAFPIRKASLIPNPVPTPAKTLPKFIGVKSQITTPARVYTRVAATHPGSYEWSICDSQVLFK